jgi:ABC-2 type transport system ATP-binding protein
MTASAASLRRRMGYIPTNPRFPPQMAPVAYLDYVARLCCLPAAVRKAKPAFLLRAVGLTDAAGDRIGGFSHGMLARLAVAASLVNEPELLVWDEPMHGLDLEARRSMFDLIKRMGEEKTLILASHHLGDIDEVCSHVALLNAGHLISQGTIDEFRGGSAPTRFEFDLDGDPKVVAKVAQALKGVNELKAASATGRKLEVQVKDAAQNTGALAAVLTTLADNKLNVVGVRTAGQPAEAAFLRLMQKEEARGFVRLYQDREAA